MDRFVRAHNHKKHRKPSDQFLNNRKDVNCQLKRMLQGLLTGDNEIKNAVSKPCEVYSSSDSYSDFEDSELNGINLDINDSVPVCDASNNTDVSDIKERILVKSMSKELNDNKVVDCAEGDQQVVNMYTELSSDCTSITCDDDYVSDSTEDFDLDKNLAIKIIEKLTSEGILYSSLNKSKSEKKVHGIEVAELDIVKTEPEIQMKNENIPQSKLKENVPESELKEDVPESSQELEEMESEPENEPELEFENAPEVEVIENAPALVAVHNVPRVLLNFDMADPKLHTNGKSPRKMPHDYVSILVNHHPYLPLADIIGNYKHSTCRNVPSYPGKGYFRKVEKILPF